MVVADGVIDVRDLAFVSQRLPAGTRCQLVGECDEVQELAINYILVCAVCLGVTPFHFSPPASKGSITGRGRHDPSGPLLLDHRA
jgi:hypothetical protein